MCLNSLAIINESRVLQPLGMDKPFSDGAIKNQLSLLLYSVRTYMRLPLIIANCVFILFEILFG